MLGLYLLLCVIIILLVVILLLSYTASAPKDSNLFLDVKNKLADVVSHVSRIEPAVRSEIVINRAETNSVAKTRRDNALPHLLLSVTLFLDQSTVPRSCNNIN
jgi:hypothetical protein